MQERPVRVQDALVEAIQPVEEKFLLPGPSKTRAIGDGGRVGYELMSVHAVQT